MHITTLTRLATAAAVIVPLTAPAALRAASESEPSLGSVRFPVSCAATVQPQFEQAVALLHHMAYQQALHGFQRVAAADPECAMAQWGIAMSLFQPLWPNRPGADQLSRGRRAVERARALQPATERERLYIAAVGDFFRDETADYWQRIARWERGQETLYRAYPEDLDAAAFFALAHLATASPAYRPVEHHERAARILLEIHRLEPAHPGGVHYTIHANDFAGREGMSLEIVRSYGEIAPHNPHALHMPTHIFVRLGSWQEVIDWNRSASQAALAHPAGEQGEYVSDELPHTLEYLVYAALQKGDVAVASEAWEQVRKTANLQPTFKTAFHLAAIPARLALERRAWAEAAELPPRQPDWVDWDRFAWPEAVTWFARGLGSARIGDLGAARRAATTIGQLRDRAREGGEKAFAREIEILRLEVEAWIAYGEGKPERALAQMQSAVDLEKTAPKQPVTPAPLLPAQELMADMLLEMGRPQQALEAYAVSLRSAPGRLNSIRGADRARASAGGQPRTSGE